MKSKQLMFWMAVLFVFVGSMIVWAAYRRGVQGSFAGFAANTGPLDEFQLIERSGKKFDLTSLQGQVWVASFFFTACPQECWRQNLYIKDLVDEYGRQGVKFISITCDPERDTPLQLADYAKRLQAHHEHWLFLTGNLEYIQRLGQDKFKLSVTPTTHSQKLMLVNPIGDVLGYFSWQEIDEMDLMRTKMDEMLATVKDSDQNETKTAPEKPTL